ncbi:hypothetical protein B0H14DRAFT_3133847, partial [Mycena olivaceomarginata]
MFDAVWHQLPSLSPYIRPGRRVSSTMLSDDGPVPGLYLLPLDDSFFPPKRIPPPAPGPRPRRPPAETRRAPPAPPTACLRAVLIRDVKSSNGTFVNGDRLSPEGVNRSRTSCARTISLNSASTSSANTARSSTARVAARVTCAFTPADAARAVRAEQRAYPPPPPSDHPSNNNNSNNNNNSGLHPNGYPNNSNSYPNSNNAYPHPGSNNASGGGPGGNGSAGGSGSGGAGGRPQNATGLAGMGGMGAERIRPTSARGVDFDSNPRAIAGWGGCGCACVYIRARRTWRDGAWVGACACGARG